MLCNFKVGDIVKSNENIIFQIDTICYCGLEVFGRKLENNEQIHYGSDEITKVTFYEMLDFLLHQRPRFNLIIKVTEDELNLIYKLLKKASLIRIEHLWKERLSDDTIMFYVRNGFYGYGEVNINFNFDNLDFEKDLKEIEIKEKINETLDIVEDNLKDAFKKVIIYGEEVSFNDMLDRLKEQLMPKVEIKPFVPEISFYSNWKPNYINIFNIDKAPKCIMVAGAVPLGGKTKTLKEMYMESMREDKMTREQVANAIKDMIRHLNKKEPEDEVFINTKNKTTVIKWVDGELTKVTYDPKDEYKQSLEKGILICALRKYMTTGEINKYLKWSHTNEDMELGMLIALAKQYFTVDKLNELIDKAMESQEKDLKKYRKKSNKEVKKTLADNLGEKPTNPKIGIKIKKKKEE